MLSSEEEDSFESISKVIAIAVHCVLNASAYSFILILLLSVAYRLYKPCHWNCWMALLLRRQHSTATIETIQALFSITKLRTYRSHKSLPPLHRSFQSNLHKATHSLLSPDTMKPQVRGRHVSKRSKFSRDKPNRGQRAPLASFRGVGYNDGVHVTLDERTVGIQCFRVPNIAGFSGIMKHRYSDFIVREVDTNGTIVSLTELPRHSTPSSKLLTNPKTLCEVLHQKISQFFPADSHSDNKKATNLLDTIVKSIFTLWKSLKKQHRDISTKRKIQEVQDLMTTELKSAAIAEQMTQFLHKMLHSSGTTAESDTALQEEFLLPEVKDKATRTRIHQSVRIRFGHAIVSDTIANSKGISVIRLRRLFVSGKKRKDVDRRETNRWDKNRPEFLEFTLYKRNMDTNVVMAALARAMRCRVGNFGFAGTKDKRGVTTQRCTLYHGSKEQLERLNRLDRSLDEFNFLVGNTRFVAEKLKLGDLIGNQFSITIRQVSSDSEGVLHEAISAWKEYGFINYFGLQRFGTRSIPTYEIGRALLRQNHKEAIDLIMRPQSGDPSKIHQAREKFQQHQNVEAALLEFPPYLVAERAILQGLERHGLSAWGQAVQCIPRPLRMVSSLLLHCDAESSISVNRCTRTRIRAMCGIKSCPND